MISKLKIFTENVKNGIHDMETMKYVGRCSVSDLGADQYIRALYFNGTEEYILETCRKADLYSIPDRCIYESEKFTVLIFSFSEKFILEFCENHGIHKDVIAESYVHHPVVRELPGFKAAVKYWNDHDIKNNINPTIEERLKRAYFKYSYGASHIVY